VTRQTGWLRLPRSRVLCRLRRVSNRDPWVEMRLGKPHQLVPFYSARARWPCNSSARIMMLG
jgi:hypothetical protein